MKITVNGTTVEVPDGSSVSVVDNQVIVNGTRMDGVTFNNNLKIVVEGGLIHLRAERGSVTVNGDVTGSVNAVGSVTCGNVGGSVDATGAVTCGNVAGDVDASGSVQCGDVGGDIDATGSVTRR